MSNSSLFNNTFYPSGRPTAFLNETFGNWSNPNQPTSFPTFNVSSYPTLYPTMNATAMIATNIPTAPPRTYDIVEDITNPKRFNFVALALSLGLLLIVVSVTIFGWCQRYEIVRKKSLATYRYRRSRRSTSEKLQMYFREDLGSTHDVNNNVRGLYTFQDTPYFNPLAELQTSTEVVNLMHVKLNET